MAGPSKEYLEAEARRAAMGQLPLTDAEKAEAARKAAEAEAIKKAAQPKQKGILDLLREMFSGKKMTEEEMIHRSTGD